MKKPNRDLLVMFNQELMSPQALEHEVMRLHELLHHYERPSTIVASYEVIDMIHYRIARKPARIKRYMRSREPQPFIFFLNLN